MKRYIYIALFTLLGLLIATLLHAAVELPTLKLITGNIEQYGNSYVWQHWKLLHGGIGALLWVLGLVLGYWGGVKWWQILYVEQRYGKPRI